MFIFFVGRKIDVLSGAGPALAGGDLHQFRQRAGTRKNHANINSRTQLG